MRPSSGSATIPWLRYPWAAPLLVCVLIGLLTLLFPGDSHFDNDESSLIGMALDANASHLPAAHGLLGTYDVHYGPLPVWLYQAILLLTHDLPTVVLIRAAIFIAATAAGLFWLASTLGWWRWFVPIILVGPYFWTYARMPWDNTLAMPIGTLTLAVFASLVIRPAGWKVAATLVGTWALVTTHLMSAPLVLALAASLFIGQWRQLLAYRWWVVGAILLLAICSIPYLQVLHRELPGRPPGLTNRNDGLVLCLNAPRTISATDLQGLYGDQWTAVALPTVRPAIVITAFAYPLFWGGMVACLWSVLRRRLDPDQPAAVDLLRLLLLAVLLQLLIFTLRGLPRYTHYNNGMWAVHVAIAWWAADLLVRRFRAAPWLLAGYGISLAAVTCILAWQLHSYRYDWPLAERVQIVRQLVALPDGATVEIALTDGDFHRPRFDVVARIMRLPPIPWARKGQGQYILKFAGPLTHRYTLEPRDP